MRYVFAVIFMVLGVVLGGFGILQKTVLAPSDTITATADLDSPGPLVVVDPGMLNLYPGPARLTVEGTDDVTIAQASKENIDAWVGDTAHTEITGLTSESALKAEKSDGKDSAPNPAAADLWTSVQTGAAPQTLDWDQDAGRTAFLIGTDGKSDAAQQVSISWQKDAATPWAVPLMVAGGIAFLIGLVLLFMGIRRGQRERRRRTARQERRRKLAETGAAFAVVPALALAGCGAQSQELPEPSPADKPSTATAVIDDGQAERILHSASEAVAQADSNLSSKTLETRASGPFGALRKKAYAVKKKAKDVDLPPALAADSITLNYTSATDAWPRVTTLVTEDSDSGQTQLIVLKQDTARSDYKVWSQSVLLSGSQIPEVNDARQGSTLLGADASGLVKTPQDTVSAYAKALAGGSKSGGEFGDDDYAKQVKKSLEDQKKALAEGNATIDAKYTPGKNVVAQQTADGGAVVVGSMTSTRTISPESTGGRSGTLSVPKPQSELVKETSTSKKLTTDYAEIVAFVVPKKGGGKPQLIGVTEAMTGAELT